MYEDNHNLDERRSRPVRVWCGAKAVRASLPGLRPGVNIVSFMVKVVLRVPIMYTPRLYNPLTVFVVATLWETPAWIEGSL